MTRQKYPDSIRFLVPEGFREKVTRAAHREDLSMSEYLRRIIKERLESEAVDEAQQVNDRSAA